jgi:hypothetical protein
MVNSAPPPDHQTTEPRSQRGKLRQGLGFLGLRTVVRGWVGGGGCGSWGEFGFECRWVKAVGA